MREIKRIDGIQVFFGTNKVALRRNTGPYPVPSCPDGRLDVVFSTYCYWKTSLVPEMAGWMRVDFHEPFPPLTGSPILGMQGSQPPQSTNEKWIASIAGHYRNEVIYNYRCLKSG